MAASIGRWVTEVEEVGRQENSVWIPARARVRIYTFSYLPLQRKGVLIYQMLQDGKYGENFLNQVELTW
jgi:hypothetical protein